MDTLRIGQLAVVAAVSLSAGCTGSASHDASSPAPTTASSYSAPSSPAPSGAEGPVALPVHPWHARLVGAATLQPDTTTVLAGRLYAITEQAEAVIGTSHLVRLDPRSGRVVARSARTVAWQLRPVLADGLVWAVDAETTTVVGFDPITLAESTSVKVPLPGSAEQGIALAPGGALSAVVLGGGRTIAFVDASGVRRRLSVDGQVSRIALSPSGTKLYVVVLTTNHESARLESLDPVTGAQLAAPISTGPLLGPLATTGGLWDVWAGGHAAGIEFRRADNLSTAMRPGAGGSGGGEDVLPAISAGVLWLGSDSVIGCADPDTGVLRARARVGVGPGGSVLGYISGMAALAGKIYAIFSGSVGGRDEATLIEMTPPPACFS